MLRFLKDEDNTAYLDELLSNLVNNQLAFISEDIIKENLKADLNQIDKIYQ
jgi:hypothetical protein